MAGDPGLDVGRGLAGLRRVAFLLERELAPTYRVKAFRSAAVTLAELPVDAVAQRAQRGTLTDLPGIGLPPTLKVANGLSPERLLQQLDVVDQVNTELAPFRLLATTPRRSVAGTSSTATWRTSARTSELTRQTRPVRSCRVGRVSSLHGRT